MTEKSRLISKPISLFAIGFIINFGWMCGDTFLGYREKLPSSLDDIIPLIAVVILFFNIDSYFPNTKGKGFSSRMKAYCAIGGGIIGLLCGEAVAQYF
jgi:hypothetical protein